MIVETKGTAKPRQNNTDAPILSVRGSDKSKPYIPLAGLVNDGWTREDKATATCFCGSVQLAFPTTSPGFVSSFVCNCTDCRKITASMFTAAFVVKDEYLEHLRGQSNLKTFAQNHSIATGNLMTNFFCGTCGTLMYRVSERAPGHSIMRLGTVDDFNLVETKLKPQMEVFVKDRVEWFSGIAGEGVACFDASPQ
ncbi:Mss4-like protein [Dendryphion nanum]|uniref:Mss4-like protein n=1 Tax=Dendryphion nanum TaxID=256645 RepID=A0A9P9D273_9PLEO|nr:Mss4-like protein [Dendryphion nanum]